MTVWHSRDNHPDTCLSALAITPSRQRNPRHSGRRGSPPRQHLTIVSGAAGGEVSTVSWWVRAAAITSPARPVINALGCPERLPQVHPLILSLIFAYIICFPIAGSRSNIVAWTFMGHFPRVRYHAASFTVVSWMLLRLLIRLLSGCEFLYTVDNDPRTDT